MIGDMNVVFFEMSKDKIIETLRRAASNNNIIITHHAKQRMHERRILMRHVEVCLQKGDIVEGPYLSDKNDWKVTLRRTVAGMRIKVEVALNIDECAIVVTAMKES